MSRAPVITANVFDYIKNLMEEVPQKEGEKLDDYTVRLNTKYSTMRAFSSDTYSRIRRMENYEAYLAYIRKKHPPKDPACIITTFDPDDDKKKIADEIDKAIEILSNIKQMISDFASDMEDAVDLASDEEYINRLYETFGKGKTEVV